MGGVECPMPLYRCAPKIAIYKFKRTKIPRHYHEIIDKK